MKFILMVSTLVMGGNGSEGHTAAEAMHEYGSKEACVQAVEIRTGQNMTSFKGGMKLTVNLQPHAGAGRTVFVCSPYGVENE